MSVESNIFLQFPYAYGQKLTAPKFSLAELQSRCAAHLAVPPSLPTSTSSPDLNGARSEADENVDNGALRSRSYSILSCSNDLEYISRFNEKVLKVSMPSLRGCLPVKPLSLLTPLLCSSSVSHVLSSSYTIPLAHVASSLCVHLPSLA